jgi:hypothetical protein
MRAREPLAELDGDRGGSEHLKLIDFGVAQIGPQTGDTKATPKLTQPGERVGTFEYMAPEQLLAEPIDHRADLFAVGIVLYECLAGEPPFPGGAGELLRALVAGQAPPSLGRVLGSGSRALDLLFGSLLVHDRSRRPQSALELAERIRAALAAPLEPIRILDSGAPANVTRAARQHTRAPFVAPARALDAEGRSHDGQTEDVSEGGVLAMLATAPVVGSEVRLRFGLPMSGRVATVGATVRWARQARRRHAVGLEFRDMPSDAVAEIRRFVELSWGQSATA